MCVCVCVCACMCVFGPVGPLVHSGAEGVFGGAGGGSCLVCFYVLGFRVCGTSCTGIRANFMSIYIRL